MLRITISMDCLFFSYQLKTLIFGCKKCQIVKMKVDFNVMTFKKYFTTFKILDFFYFWELFYCFVISYYLNKKQYETVLEI